METGGDLGALLGRPTLRSVPVFRQQSHSPIRSQGVGGRRGAVSKVLDQNCAPQKCTLRAPPPPPTQTEQIGKISLHYQSTAGSPCLELVPVSPKSALSSESYRITPLATAGVPTLSIGARILGTPCDLKRVTCARKVATNAGRPSRPGSKQSTKITAHPPTHPVQLSNFETGAS
jgi:hypothetical protein